MKAPIKFRVALFVTAIVLAALLIGWAGHKTWRALERLNSSLTADQLTSFQIADQFRANLQSLDKLLLHYELDLAPADWRQFTNESQRLNDWIDEVRPKLRTEQELVLMKQIDDGYDVYLAAASNLVYAIDLHPTNTVATLKGYASLSTQSAKLMSLGSGLFSAHRDAMQQLIDSNHQYLKFLAMLMLGALVLLLGLSAWLAVEVYRSSIAPLRVKLVESQLLLERQEKLAALGMLAAGVAHEIRNPLTAVKAWLYIQRKNLVPGTPEFADAEVIGNELVRLERIVKDFLQFARPTDPQLAPVPADQPLREVQALLGPALEKSNIALVLEPSSAPPVRVDGGQMRQVLLNLVQNAAESIGQSGQITLRARAANRPLGNRLTPVVILEVADTGKGIPPDVQKRLFDPFFTTKDTGTGLGLSIAARIIEKHGGALQYQTQVNRGTTFGIVLPQATDESARSRSAH